MGSEMCIRDRHKSDGLAVLEAKCRSFPPIDAMTIEFDFPKWKRSDESPVLQNRQSKSKKMEDASSIAKLKGFFSDGESFSASDIRRDVGWGNSKAVRILTSHPDVFEPTGERPPQRSNGNIQQLFRFKEEALSLIHISEPTRPY